MNPDDLELYSTQDLIDELMRRTTFLGVVVHAREEMRGPWQDGHRTFRVRVSPGLGADEAGRLLAVVGGRIDREFP
jgi:hypothetical protein